MKYMPFWDPKEKRPRGPKKYLHPKQESMAVRILDMIEKTGGMTPNKIKRQLFQWSRRGRNGDEYCPRLGWWSTNLYDSRKHHGLLPFFCTKNGDKWVRNNVPHCDKPFSLTRKYQKYAAALFDNP